MDVKIRTGADFLKIVNAVSELSDYLTMKLQKNGISINQMDVSGIAMISTFIQPSTLQEYIFNDNDKLIQIDISRPNMKLLKSIKDDNLLLTINDKVLDIKTNTQQIQIPILDATKEDKEPSGYIYPNLIIVNAKQLKEILKTYKKIVSYVRFEIRGKDLVLGFKNDAINSEIVIPNVVINNSEPCSVLYNLEYVYNLISACSNKNDIEIYLKNDSPIKLVYEIGGNKIKGYLAPYFED